MVANNVRAEAGPAAIIQELVGIAEKSNNENVVIESIRTTGEVEALKKMGAKLISIDADPKIRWTRIIARASETDSVTYEEFIEAENKEMGGSDPGKQNLVACMSLADVKFVNNGSIEELNELLCKGL